MDSSSTNGSRLDPEHNEPDGTASVSTDSDATITPANINRQNARSTGFPRFSELPPQIAAKIWEMAILDYQERPKFLAFADFPVPEGYERGYRIPSPFRTTPYWGPGALDQVCRASRRVFQALGADCPAVFFHLWPRVVPCLQTVFRRGRHFPWRPTMPLGCFVNPYDVHADRHPEADMVLHLHDDAGADTLYVPLSALLNLIHQEDGPHARRPTYILAGESAYQIPSLDFFFDWKSPPPIALSADETAYEVERDAWPASVNSLDLQVPLDAETITWWTAVFRMDRTPTGRWETGSGIPAAWGLEFDRGTAWGASRFAGLFPPGSLRHVVFVVEKLPRTAERQGPHDLARFGSFNRLARRRRNDLPVSLWHTFRSDEDTEASSGDEVEESIEEIIGESIWESIGDEDGEWMEGLIGESIARIEEEERIRYDVDEL